MVIFWRNLLLGGILVSLSALQAAGKTEAVAADQASPVRPANVESNLNFLWGVSTSPYQTEDVAVSPDDPMFFKTDWDIFYDIGKISEPRGDAVSSYTHYKRDIETLQKLGVTHYRFGIEWARIEPKPGVYNEKALQHYVEMAKALKAAGIEPIVCYWHFTFPNWGYTPGKPESYGWLSPVVQERWGPFVKKATESFKGIVQIYAPQNEPNAHALAGFFLGIFPPAAKYNLKLFRAHIRAAADRFNEAAVLIRQVQPDAKVISVQNIISWDKVWWDFFSYFYDLGAEFNFEHLDLIKDNIDWVGFNYYYKVKASPLPNPRVVSPEGLAEMMRQLHQRYKKPLVIMENGWPDKAGVSKQEYFDQHWAVVKALRQELDVRGYFYWSLIDNFEWAEGYKEKYGLFKFNGLHQPLTPYPVVESLKAALQADRGPDKSTKR